MKRKLTTIMVADAVSYSARMAKDEAGTLEALHRARAAMEKLFARHDGRKVNTWGDAIIAEFESVIAAVQCAVEIQNELSRRGDGEGEGLTFRIGINLGDVIVDGDDLIGDGVNIAARLQEIAPPGGVVISGSVHDQVHQKLALGFDPMAPQVMKNIGETVPLWSVRLGGANRPPEPHVESHPHPDVADEPEPWHGPGPPWHRGDRPGPPIRAAFHAFREWYPRQPARIRTAVGMIALFFVIDILSGPGSFWFFWPSIPFAAMIIIHLLRGEEERREGS